MSHPQQMEFVQGVKARFPNYFSKANVLEVGSLNINGSVRPFFENCFYIGIDVDVGPCVDIVSKGEEFDAADASFDSVISCECFEHNPSWVDTFKNMYRMCKPNGLILVTCATTGRKEHGTPSTEPASSPLTVKMGWTYYKNLTAEDFHNTFPIKDWFNQFEFSTNETTHDLYFWGVKRA